MAAGDELRAAMERGAARLKVLKQPPLDFLTYLWSQLQMGAMSTHVSWCGSQRPDARGGRRRLRWSARDR